MKTLIGYSKRFTIAPLARHLTCLVLLISAVRAGEEVRVEKSGDAVIVRSGSDHANFLLRAPADFDRQSAEKSYLVHLAADRGGAKGSIRLRIGDVAAADIRKPAATLARAREAEYKKRMKSYLKIEGTGARATATMPGRTVLLVRDGTKLYELFLDGGDAFGKEFATVADGSSDSWSSSRWEEPSDARVRPLLEFCGGAALLAVKQVSCFIHRERVDAEGSRDGVEGPGT